MPRVTSIVPEEPTISAINDRIEIDASVVLDDHSTHVYQFNTSYKKHVFESYTNGDDSYTPTAAATNTVAVVSQLSFKTAFSAYVRNVCQRIKEAADVSTFDPSEAANELEGTRGLTFHSDVATVGGNIHCFPTATGSSTMEFSRAEFGHFKAVMKFMYNAGATSSSAALAAAKRGWPSTIKTKIQGAGALSTIQIASLERRLRNAAADISEARSAANQHHRMRPRPNDGRPPFRG